MAVAFLLSCALPVLATCAGEIRAPSRPADSMTALPDPNPDQGRIYFYRPRGSLFPAVEPDVIVNGRKVGVSVRGEAFYRDAYPGYYEIFLTSDRERFLILSVEPGKTTFVRTSVAFSLLGPRLTPKLVQETRGRHEVGDLILVEPEIVD
jgi:hypothetical protein